MIKITHQQGSFIELVASGKVDRSDYASVAPQLEEAASSGNMRSLIQLKDFEGWTTGGLIEEFKFDAEHRDDLEKTAIVGDRKWERWATRLSRPFFSGKMRFFEDAAQARRWVQAP